LEYSVNNHPNLELVAKGSSASDANQFVGIDHAHVAMIDVNLPDESGILVGQQLLQRIPDLRLLFLCDHDWDIYLIAARGIGASGVFTRSVPAEDIIFSINQVMKAPLYNSDQLNRIQSWKDKFGKNLQALKAHEWKVLWQVAAGLSNREIAKKLELSHATVEKYVSRILERMELSSRSALVVLFYHNHLEVLCGLPETTRLMIVGN